MFCTSGPNLVIVAWAGDKLSSGQTDDWRTHTHTYTHTHTHTHRQTQATTIPEGHNWPRVKIMGLIKFSLQLRKCFEPPSGGQRVFCVVVWIHKCEKVITWGGCSEFRQRVWGDSWTFCVLMLKKIDVVYFVLVLFWFLVLFLFSKM